VKLVPVTGTSALSRSTKSVVGIFQKLRGDVDDDSVTSHPLENFTV
jgi:hypothetical protein